MDISARSLTGLDRQTQQKPDRELALHARSELIFTKGCKLVVNTFLRVVNMWDLDSV